MNNGEIIVTLASDEKHFDFDRFDLTFDSSDSEIIDALNPVLEEEEGTILEEGEWVVKKIDSSGNIFLFPKSSAGN